MEHRKNRHFWLKLAIASVLYSVVVSLTVLVWTRTAQAVIPGSLAYALFGSAIASIVVPGMAALLLLGSLYRMNFFLEFWRGRGKPYDMGARFFTIFVAVPSGLFSMSFILWPAIGGVPFDVIFMVAAVNGSIAAAFLVADSIVHGERTLAERVAGRADAGEAGA